MTNTTIDTNRVHEIKEAVWAVDADITQEEIEELLYNDWTEPEHQEWVNTAPLEEIVSWIRSFEV